MTYLPDVNVWIALAAERHAFHRAARHWFSNLHDENFAFCRLTQLGFLRLLTNKHVMQEEVMRPDEAWQAYRVLRLDRRIGYLADVTGPSSSVGLFPFKTNSNPAQQMLSANNFVHYVEPRSPQAG